MKIFETRKVKRFFPDDGDFLSGDEYYVEEVYLFGIPVAVWVIVLVALLLMFWGCLEA